MGNSINKFVKYRIWQLLFRIIWLVKMRDYCDIVVCKWSRSLIDISISISRIVSLLFLLRAEERKIVFFIVLLPPYIVSYWLKWILISLSKYGWYALWCMSRTRTTSKYSNMQSVLLTRKGTSVQMDKKVQMPDRDRTPNWPRKQVFTIWRRGLDPTKENRMRDSSHKFESC
jgi:hypothetical protein